jgi:hydrogenase nickel incorporation protein HypA/HybF
MHELTITQGILSIVLQKAREVQARKITKIDLRLGRLTGYIPECIQFQFTILSKDTPAASAILSFHQPPVKLHCRNCSMDYSTDSLDLVCPGCQRLDMDILSGLELSVDSMEVE